MDAGNGAAAAAAAAPPAAPPASGGAPRAGAAGPADMPSKRSPTEFLKAVIGRPVVVKLNNGTDYRGVLACLDGFMNLALEQTEEYVNGELQNQYGDCFIRGNNVLFISAAT